MKRFFSELRFYESYSFAQAINNILHDRFSYIRSLSGFYGDGNYFSYIKPFEKYSAFHSFIRFIVFDTIYDENCNFDLEKRQEGLSVDAEIKTLFALGQNPENLPINDAFDFYQIQHETFVDWLKNYRDKDFLDAVEDDVSEYLDDLILTGEYDRLVERIVGEVFFILFQNRQILLLFNHMMAEQNDLCDNDEIPEHVLPYFTKTGRIRRTAIPSWVRRAVYHRDRGMCVLCYRDLSGILAISNRENFDHIYPLAQGGLNDISNIQLLCADCNNLKRHQTLVTSSYYEQWYPLD